MSWVAAAVGSASAIYGAVNANQKKQRDKGYIDASYRNASEGLDTRQTLARQNAAESLNQRGILGPQSPIQRAMMPGASPTSLGDQVQADNEKQFGLERRDLDQQHDQASHENRAAYTDALVGSVMSGASTAAGVYGAKQDAGMYRGASPIQKAMMPSQRGVDDVRVPGAFGIDPVDPLGRGAWAPLRLGTGQPVYDFSNGAANG